MNLMGRAKTLWSHTRDMRVDVSRGLVKYTVPIGNETLGDFVKAVKHGPVVVIYYRNVPATVTERRTECVQKIDTASREPALVTIPDPFKVVF